MCETFIGGNAVRLAAQDVKKKLFRIVADEFGVSEEQLSAKHRKIFVTNDPQQEMSIAKAVRMALTRNESISGEGSYWPKVDWRREWVKNPYGQLSETFSFGTVICEVKVDPETGQVEVLEVTASQDVGHALNPKVIEGQFEGGVAMGGQGGEEVEVALHQRCLGGDHHRIPVVGADLGGAQPGDDAGVEGGTGAETEVLVGVARAASVQLIL
jgi:xanthine dehydrogenase molybdopterin-binding subunit B